MEYTYSIASDTSNALLNSEILISSVEASTITKTLTTINSSGDSFTIVFDESLTAEEQTTLNALVAAHDGTPTPDEEIPQKVELISTTQSQPFTSKVLSDGRKLFKRVHGIQNTITAGQTGFVSFIIPYTQAKVTGLEILGSKHGCTGNFNVYDNASGTISTIPNLKLNQFGFDVNIQADFHIEESTYDADLILGMKLELEFTNNTNEDLLICGNFILHEVV